MYWYLIDELSLEDILIYLIWYDSCDVLSELWCVFVCDEEWRKVVEEL